MHQQFLDLFEHIEANYGNILVELQGCKELIDPQDTLNDAADNVYALREMTKVVEQSLKELKKTLSQAEKTACLIQIMDPNEQDSASTPYCSGKAKVSQVLQTPAKRRYDPEAFDKLMEFLGVPKETYLAELVRFNWPAVQEVLNERQEKGESIPVKTTEANVYSFTTRKRKALTS